MQAGKRIRDVDSAAYIGNMHCIRSPTAAMQRARDPAARSRFSRYSRPTEQRLPFVFNSPHSGRSTRPTSSPPPGSSERAIRRSEDIFVDELFAPVVPFGAPLLRANFPRAWLDVNREPYELDPQMFAGALPPYANSARCGLPAGSARSPASSPRTRRSMPARSGRGGARADRARLQALSCRLGRLIAAHPSDVRHRRPDRLPFDAVVGARAAGRARADIVHRRPLWHELRAGTRRARLRLPDRLGYSVSRNKPYAGGYITEHYGRPGRGIHALQIEVNRALYMNERTLAERRASKRARGSRAASSILSQPPTAGLHPSPLARRVEPGRAERGRKEKGPLVTEAAQV